MTVSEIAIGDDKLSQVEPQMADNHDEPVVILPRDDGQTFMHLVS